MKPEEIEKMKADLAAATKAKEEAEAALKKANEDLETANTTIKEKDQVIEQKNQDLIGARKKYSEMTEAERAKLTEQERSIAQQQEELAKNQENFMKQQQEFQDNQIKYHRTEAIKRVVGNDEEAIKKVEFAFDRIKDSDKAQTPDEISKLVGEAYNMLGEDRPTAVNTAANSGGGNAPGGSQDGNGFAESEAGKELSNLMGLGEPEKAPADPNNPPAPANPAVNELDAAI